MGGVEGFIRSAVLVHLDGKTEPGFGIRVRGSPVGHSCKGRRDSMVEPSAEFHYDCFQVGVAGVLNEVLELVKVIVD